MLDIQGARLSLIHVGENSMTCNPALLPSPKRTPVRLVKHLKILPILKI